MGRTAAITLALVLAAPSAVAAGGAGPRAVVAPQLGRYFGAFSGCLVLHDLEHDEFLRVNPEQCQKRLPGGDLFDLHLALDALETGAVAGVDAALPWDGVRRPVAAWNQDQSLSLALRNGTTWFFQRVAERIGAEPLYTLSTNAPLGATDMSAGLTTFWLGDGFRLSANEGVVFLARLHRGQLPYRPEVVGAVKPLLVLRQDDQAELSGLAATIVRDGKARVGWFLGRLRSPAGEFVFAVNIEGPDRATGENAQEIATTILRARRLLP